MHHVETHVARSAFTQQRVKVGTVVVHQATTIVYHFGNGRYVFLEQSQGVGVGHHHRSHVVAQQLFQVFGVNGAFGRAFHLHNIKSAHGGRCGIGAVSRVGNNHLGAFRVVVCLMVGTNNHQTRKLALRSGKGIEGKLVQTRYFGECLLQSVQCGQRALAGVGRLCGVQIGEGRHGRNLFVDNRIVLHCAAAQWIKAVVYAEVVAAVVGVMPHHSHFVAFGKLCIAAPFQFVGYWMFPERVVWQVKAAASRPRKLEYQVAI